MGQDSLVNLEIENGRKLIDHLATNGFDVHLAFWVKETDAGRWYLYLASPLVDEKGPLVAYGIAIPLVESVPEFGIGPFSIKVVGLQDSMTMAARKAIRPRVPSGPFAVKSPKPYPGMTRVNGTTLAGVDIDGAYIYPPLHSATPA